MPPSPRARWTREAPLGVAAATTLTVLLACGGSTAGPRGVDEAGTDRNAGGGAEAPTPAPGAPTETQCTVQVVEGGEERGTTTYSFTDGVLMRVVTEDRESARRFTTSYAWNESGSAVAVEKNSDQGTAPATIEMRYRGERGAGPVVGERLEGEVVVERITWWFDTEARPLKRNHEWMPTTAERDLGLEGRAEGDVCRYDAAGRPVAFDMSLVEERVLEVRYEYEGDGRFPTTISERHVVDGDEGAPQPGATVAIESQAPLSLTVTWANAPTRTTRYRGDCAAVFFPAVCSTTSAPRP